MKPLYRQVAPWCVLLMLAGFAAIVFSAGDLSDDYWYRCEFTCVDAPADSLYTVNYSRFENCAGPVITEPGQIPPSFANHWRYWNNARLSSLLMMCTNLIPGWVTDLLQVLMMALMSVMLLRLAIGERWREHPLVTALLLWGIWLVLPWYNQMLSTVYMMTYIWGTALMLSAVWCLLTGRGPTWAVCLLAFVAAMMHEGITVPVLCGVIVDSIGNRKQGIGNRNWLIVAAMTAGLLVISLCPSIFARIGWDNHGADSISRTLFFLCTRMTVLPVSVVVIGVVCIVRGKEYTARYVRENILWIVCAIVSVAGGLYTGNFDRQVWMGDVALLILLISIVGNRKQEVIDNNRQGIGDRLWGVRARRLRRRGTVTLIACLLSILLCGWLCVIAMYQREGMREFERVEQAMASGEEPLFVDVRQPYSLPWWVLEIPEMYQNQYAILRLNHCAYATQGRRRIDPVVFPTAANSGDTLSLPGVPGNAGLRGVFPWYVSTRRLNMPYSKLGYTIRKGGGTQKIEYMTRERPIIYRGDTLWCYRPEEWSRSSYRCPVIAIDVP